MQAFIVTLIMALYGIASTISAEQLRQVRQQDREA